MLRIARVTDQRGRYYLADLAAELGVAGPAGAPPGRSSGTWLGDGAAGLGLFGPVDDVALGAVLSGRHPHGRHPLRRRRAAVAGYDLVFAAPKSVSVLFGLGAGASTAATLDAHREAVAFAVDYVARRAAGVRAGSGEDRRAEPVRGLVAARFDHGVSRALDPHLHSHVVLANLAQNVEGRWLALDGRGLDAHAPAAGALYGAHLRDALTRRLGARWVRRHSGAYELASVDPAVLGALSSRQAEIRARAYVHGGAGRPGDAGGRASGRGRAVAWAATREEKAPSVERAPGLLRERWRGRVADVGWTPGALARSLSELGPPRRGAVVDEHGFAAAIHRGTVHGGSPRRDVVAAWAGSLADGAAAGDIECCVDALAPWGRAVGVDEEVRPRAGIVAAPQALRVLGARPADPAALAVWQSVAVSVDRARTRSAGIGALLLVDRDAGGQERRSAMARLTTEELAAYLALERVVADARRRLGVGRSSAPREAERSLGRG